MKTYYPAGLIYNLVEPMKNEIFFLKNTKTRQEVKFMWPWISSECASSVNDLSYKSCILLYRR